MRGLSDNTPKPMIPVANRPILEITFSRLKLMGIDSVALVIGYQGERLQQLIGDGHQYGVDVTYVWQREQLGTGHAVTLCEEFVGGEPFILIFGDILTRESNYAEMARLYNGGTCDAVLSVFPVEDPSNGAAVDVRDGRVMGIVEKPAPGTMLNAYNNAGLFIWPPEIFDLIRSLKRSARGEYEFTDGIVAFIEKGRRLAAFELLGFWENITDPESCIRMNQNILDEILPPARPEVYDNAQISNGAALAGCDVGPDVVVGKGCRLDGCILGQNSRIGGNVTAEYAEIRASATIGAGCQLGPAVSIGEGAFIEPTCRIGPNTSVGPACIIGAGASISSSILLAGSKVGPGCSILHAMLDVNVLVEAGTTITGTPDKAVEVLNPSQASR